MSLRSSHPARRPSHPPVGTSSIWSLPGALPAGWVRGLLGVFLVCIVGSVAGNLAGGTSRIWVLLDCLVGVLATLTLLASLARRLPLQNALACGLVLVLTSAMALAIAAHTRFPLGRFEFSDVAGPRLLGLVSWSVPFLVGAVLLSSRQSAKLILKPWRRHRYYGWLLLGCAVVLVLFLTASLEPFGHRVKGWWKWPLYNGALTWYGAPLAMLPVATLLAAGLLLCATPWLIAKRPTGLAPDIEPAVVWLALDAWLALGCLRSGLIVPAGVGLIAGITVAAFAWRATRATALTPPSVPAGAPASAG